MTTTETGPSAARVEPPMVSGGDGDGGHLDELREDPIALDAPGPRRVR